MKCVCSDQFRSVLNSSDRLFKDDLLFAFNKHSFSPRQRWQWTDCIMGKILKKVEIGKFITIYSIEEHPKICKIAKFSCETL